MADAIQSDVLEGAQSLQNLLSGLKKQCASLAAALNSLLETDFAGMIAEAQKLGYAIPPEAAEKVESLGDSTRKLDKELRGVAGVAVAGAAPALADMAKQTKAWVEQNRAWISLRVADATGGVAEGFRGCAKVMLDLKKSALDPLLEKMEPFIEKIGGWKEVITDLTAGALPALLLLLAPLIAKAAVAARGFLLLSSVFGALFAILKDENSSLRQIIDSVVEFFEKNKLLADGLMLAVGAFAALKGAAAIKTLLLGGAESAGLLARTFKALNATMKANMFMALASLAIAALLLIYENWDGITAWFSEKWEAVKETFPNFAAWAEGAVAAIKAVFGGFGEWIMTLLTGNFEEAGKQALDFFTSLGKSILGLFPKMLFKVGSVFDALLPNWLKGKAESKDDEFEGMEDIMSSIKATESLQRMPVKQNTANDNSRTQNVTDNSSKTVNIYAKDAKSAAEIAHDVMHQPAHAPAGAVAG